MAGHGPAPKDKSVRRNKAPKQRGEWVDLAEAVGPFPKADKAWPPRTKACWDSWWRDPASTQWTEADRTLIVELGHMHAEMLYGKNLHTEIRHRMDTLGLTQKGKRDLRWRVGGEPVAEPAPVAVMADYRAMVAGD